MKIKYNNYNNNSTINNNNNNKVNEKLFQQFINNTKNYILIKCSMQTIKYFTTSS